MKKNSLKKALLISPLVTPIIYLFGAQFFLVSYDEGYGVIVTMLISLLAVTIVILPISYISTLVIGIPVYLFLRKIKKLALFYLVTLGAISGISIFILLVYYGTSFAIETFYFPQIFYFISFGLVLGGCVAYMFGRIMGLRFK